MFNPDFVKPFNERRVHRDSLAGFDGADLDFVDMYMGPHPSLRKKQEVLTSIPHGSPYECRAGEGGTRRIPILPQLPR